MNICQLPKSEQNAIQRDLKAALWAWQIKNRKTSLGAVQTRIERLNDPVKESDLMGRLRNYMNTMGMNTQNLT